MSAKPWAEPRLPLEERLIAAEVAIANVDTGAERRAIMHELVGGALEEAARREDEMACYVVAARIRALPSAALAITFEPYRPIEPDPPADPEAARFRALVEQGKTGKQVAAELGVSYPRVVRLLHKSGFFRDKAARQAAKAREGAAHIARGATVAATAACLGVKQGWLRTKVGDLFRHDHPFIRRPEPPHDHGPCLWCGHPHTYGRHGGYEPWARCHARVKAIAAGDEAAMLDHHQRHVRDRDAPGA